MSTNYEHFVQANQALLDCFASVSAEQYSSMNDADQQNVCKAETNAVRDSLRSGNIAFKNILQERLRAFDKHEWMHFNI